MRLRTRHASPRLRLLIAGVLAAVLVFGAMPAHAIESPRVTLSEETGGQQTRFTFTTFTDSDALTPTFALKFPKGFDLSDYRLRITLLEGLKRIPVEYTESVTDDTVRLTFDPAIPPESELRVEVYGVMTPGDGGDYRLALAWSAAATTTAEPTSGVPAGVEERTDPGPRFSLRAPLPGEELARWLDAQAWVEEFNRIKALGMFFRPQLISLAVPMLFTGWLLSIALVAFAFPLAIAAGLALAFMRMSKIAPLRWIAGLYINVVRGTPLFLQIFIVFIGLRIAGIRVPDVPTGVFVLALNSSAYLAEIFRAGIQSIHRGQFEAASSLGMTYRQAMQYVIIPQTVKRVLPTMTSEFILLFKDTALLAAVGLPELMMSAQNLSSRNGNLTPYIVAAVYYLIVTIPLINWVQRLEERLAVSEHGQPAKEQGRRGLFWRSKGDSSDSAEPSPASEGGQR